MTLLWPHIMLTTRRERENKARFPRKRKISSSPSEKKEKGTPMTIYSDYEVIHPCDCITEFLNNSDVTTKEMAEYLRITPDELKTLISNRQNITYEQAEILSEVIGKSPNSWLQMQREYDFCNERTTKCE